jgi:hypothetical protein
MRIIIVLLLLCCTVTTLHAAQSVILDTEGYACMGDDKSRKQTEDVAVKDAKRKASEAAVTHIKSETSIRDAMLEKDLLSAYASAQVKLLKEYLKQWYKEEGLGDCFRIRMNVEVLPDEQTLAGLAQKNPQALQDDPTAPLNVKIWIDRPAYAEKELIRIYLKGNKPFHGRVVYQQADGSLVQLLPNPYRDVNTFNGGSMYELPSAGDRFSLETGAPFGTESITLYASTAPLGEIDVTRTDAVYEVRAKSADIATATRGVKVKKGEGSGKQPVAEFSESVVVITTGK